MSASMWLLTVICLAIPPALIYAGTVAPLPVRPMLIAVGGLTVAIYAFVGLWLRPVAFTLDPEGLQIDWPFRTRRIAGSAIVRARVLDRRQLRAELGYMLRIGAGGLWGGFGLVKTAVGTLELWVSRTDRIVYVECEGRRSLLITPREPERFVSELERARR
jgi:hypothetical protein